MTMTPFDYLVAFTCTFFLLDRALSIFFRARRWAEYRAQRKAEAEYAALAEPDWAEFADDEVQHNR